RCAGGRVARAGTRAWTGPAGGRSLGGRRSSSTVPYGPDTMLAAVMQDPTPGSVFLALQHLEESLYVPQTRFDSEYMEGLLSPDFVEFGSSGRVWSRSQIIRTDPVDIQARLPLPEFEVRMLGSDVALVTYRTEMGIDYATAA